MFWALRSSLKPFFCCWQFVLVHWLPEGVPWLRTGRMSHLQSVLVLGKETHRVPQTSPTSCLYADVVSHKRATSQVKTEALICFCCRRHSERVCQTLESRTVHRSSINCSSRHHRTAHIPAKCPRSLEQPVCSVLRHSRGAGEWCRDQR